MPQKSKPLGIHAVLFAALLLVGCIQSVSRAQFDRIESNMSFDEVVDILGNPKNLSSIALGPLGGLGGLKSTEAVWQSKQAMAYVRFVNGHVTVTSWQPSE